MECTTFTNKMENNFANIFNESKHQMQFMMIMDNIYNNHIDINMFKKFLQEWGNCEENLIKKGTRYDKNYHHNHSTTKEEDTSTLNEFRTKIIKDLGKVFMCRDFIIKQYKFKCVILFTSFKNNIMFVNGIDLFYNKVLK